MDVSARPVVVLVHGTRHSRAQWDGYADLLPDLELVAVDLPGHGSARGVAFSTDTAVAAIAAGVDPAGAGRPVVLVGHSLGGYMAACYAERHPDRLAGLVLIGASAVPTGPGAAIYRGFGALVDVVGPPRMARLSNGVVRRLAGPTAAATLTDDGSDYAALRPAWAAVMRDCRPEQLRAVAAPVLIVGGQLDQLAVHARRYAACCADGRVAIVPRATHLLPITHPEPTAALVRGFVRDVTTAR